MIFYFFCKDNLNEAKVNNFPEIEVFIVLSCPYYSLLEKKDFYKIMISPDELEIALGGKTWNTSICVDNQIYLKMEKIEIQEEKKEKESSEIMLRLCLF